MGCGTAVALAASLAFAGAAPAGSGAPHADALAVALSGERFTYRVAAGDHLTGIGARFGVSVRSLAADNAIPIAAPLRVGQPLAVDNRHLAPAGVDDGVLINIPQRMLFHFESGALRAAYPVALGKPAWPTPAGEFSVISRIRDKPWIVPKSIQEEMRREGKPVLTRVEPGPQNPLGRHWIGLSLPAIGIHGTIAPSSIYGLRSHGCIRLHPDDVAELFDRVSVGTRGVILYRPALLARLPDGRIFVEINPDAYRRSGPPLETLQRIAGASGLSDRVDWGKVRDAVREQGGIAREVGLRAPQTDRTPN